MKYIKIPILALLFVPCIASAQFRFKDVTPAAGIYMRSSQFAEAGPGVVVFDLNGDGWDDIYMSGGNDSDKLFLNNGNGTFTDIAQDNFNRHLTITKINEVFDT